MDQSNPTQNSTKNKIAAALGYYKSANKQQKLIIVAGGSILLVIIFFLFALLFGGAPDNKQNLITIAQRQQEIIRISDIAEDKARSSEVLSFATTTKVSINSAQQKVISNVARKGENLNTATLQQLENDETTNSLASAEQANRFDEIFIDTLRGELLEYQLSIENAYDEAPVSDRQILEEIFEDLEILIANLEQI